MQEKSGSRPGVERIPVCVNVVFDMVGSVKPLEIIWDDGRRFPIEEVISFRPVPGRSRAESCYTVRVRGKTRELFFTNTPASRWHALGLWWVEVMGEATPKEGKDAGDGEIT